MKINVSFGPGSLNKLMTICQDAGYDVTIYVNPQIEEKNAIGDISMKVIHADDIVEDEKEIKILKERCFEFKSDKL